MKTVNEALEFFEKSEAVGVEAIKCGKALAEFVRKVQGGCVMGRVSVDTDGVRKVLITLEGMRLEDGAALFAGGVVEPQGQALCHVRYRCSQRWDGNGNNDPQIYEGWEVCEAHERGDDVSAAIAVFSPNASQLALPAGPVPAELIALLREIRPNYGDVGTRDVDVARQQKQIDRAIELLASSSPAVAQPVPEGAAMTATGGIYYNIAEMKHQAEEAECVAMCLDDRGIPKVDADGKMFSLWGRVVRFAQGAKQ